MVHKESHKESHKDTNVNAAIAMDPTELPKKLHWYLARLSPTKHEPTGVVDGDTMHIVVDWGGMIYQNKSMRVANVNAPEMNTAGGPVAKAWAINWFNLNVGWATVTNDEGTTTTTGNNFYIHTHLDPTDKYGRLLAMIYAPGGECFNDDLVNAGMAVPYLVEPFG